MDYQGEAMHYSKYDMLDTIIEEVYVDCVKMDDLERKHCVQEFEKVLKQLIGSMKEVDPSFNELYKRIGYTGSYFDGLRVKHATEFDLNLILKPKFEMELHKKGCLPGFIDIEVENVVEKPMKNWVVNEKNKSWLSPCKVKSWLQGVIRRALDNITLTKYKITTTASGPAETIIITTPKGVKISVDLVPVIEFPSTQWPKVPKKSKTSLGSSYNQPWCAVPKNGSWRISFPNQERALIKDLRYYKYTAKLIKRVRDALKMDKFASYYIKTLFIWELEKNKSLNKETWSRPRGQYFMHMLFRLKEALQKTHLSFYWDEHCNLLGSVKLDTLKNYCGLISNFINDIKKLVEAGDKDRLSLYIRMKLIPAIPPEERSLPQTSSSWSCLIQ